MDVKVLKKTPIPREKIIKFFYFKLHISRLASLTEPLKRDKKGLQGLQAWCSIWFILFLVLKSAVSLTPIILKDKYVSNTRTIAFKK